MKGTMKVVINTCFGGFSLSIEGQTEYLKTSGTQVDDDIREYWSGREIARNDAVLVKMIEANSALYSGSCATLEVIEIPDDVQWEVMEYDGREWIAEKHRRWS